uniref:Uncharacterized protein n=1 Tax=Candidatus Kentrum sp. SD TaxID=2126332 RepID=A0A451BRJ1_9GAMM|nr:MAG: hypothetical protein BECKSD772D_GA0070982_11699 [Candidatus Kentron sp. SD]
MIAIFLILMQLFTAGADFLITGNGKHFPARQYGTVEVVSPREFLQRVIPTLMKRVPITLENETTTPVETMKDRYRISSRLLTNR